MNEAKTGVLMVVEDDPDVRLLVRVTLKPDPRLEIKGEASNAEEALEFLKDHQQIGLVILDHMLEEGISGLEAAPLMKEAAPHIRVLLFSALDLERQAKAEQAVDGFLLKTQIDHLLPTCQELLGLTPLR